MEANMVIVPAAQAEPAESAERRVEIRKHSSLIQMSNKISVTQRKAYNVLIHIARKQLRTNPETELFKVNLQMIKTLAGIDSTNNKELKENLKALMSTVVELNILKKDTSSVWTASTLLSEARIEDGYLEFGFSRFIFRSLRNPDMYATLDLALLRRLKSKYAVAIYELAKDYINACIPQMPIEDFRKLMGLEANQYTNGKDLRRSIIEVAVQEVNDKTDLEITYELVTERKKIVAIRFQTRVKNRTTPLPSDVELEELWTLLPEQLREQRSYRRLVSEHYYQNGVEYVSSNIAYAMKCSKGADFGLLLKRALENDLGSELRCAPRVPVQVAAPFEEVPCLELERFSSLFSGLPKEAQAVLRDRAVTSAGGSDAGDEAIRQATMRVAKDVYPELFS